MRKIPHSQQKSPKCSTGVQSQKWQNDLCFQGKPFSIRVIQVYAPTINGKKLKLVLWWSTRPRTNTKKNVLFIIGDWNANVGSQEILGVQNEVGQRLTEFCKENTLVIAHTLLQQQKRQLYTWTSPDGQCQNPIDYIFCSWIWRSFIQSAKTRPGTDCGSDHQILTAKVRLKLKKEGKTLAHSGMT